MAARRALTHLALLLDDEGGHRDHGGREAARGEDKHRDTHAGDSPVGGGGAHGTVASGLRFASHNAASLLVDWLAASLHSTLRVSTHAPLAFEWHQDHGPVRHAKLKQAARVFRVRYTGHSSSAAPSGGGERGRLGARVADDVDVQRAQASSSWPPRRTPPARTATPPRRRACRPCRRQRWRRRRQRWARLHSKASPPPTPRRATSRCRWTRRRPAHCIPAYTAQRRTPSTTAAPAPAPTSAPRRRPTTNARAARRTPRPPRCSWRGGTRPPPRRTPQGCSSTTRCWPRASCSPARPDQKSSSSVRLVSAITRVTRASRGRRRGRRR